MNSQLFADFLPPLAAIELEALRQDIEANGVLNPVLVDESGIVLDGHHRLKIDPNAPRRVIEGLSPGEKQAFVFRANFARRNLSPDQKREAYRRMKDTAAKLRSEGKTQAEIGSLLGVSQQAVSIWFATNTSTCNGSIADARVKIPPQRRPEILDRAASDTHEQIAADFGVSRQAITKIVRAEQKLVTSRQQREAVAKQIQEDCSVIHGDFRELQTMVVDESVDLIFTDPPYLTETLDLYRNLGNFAARVLRPGGWLLAYSGHVHLPTILSNLSDPVLCWGWLFCVRHSGGYARFRGLRFQVGWKPILAFYKPPVAVTWDWFSDTVSGGREKHLHEWQQAEAEAAHFIERLSSPGGFVCDPFCGSGTTLAAAKAIGRRWIGFEIEAEHVETARVRLAGPGQATTTANTLAAPPAQPYAQESTPESYSVNGGGVVSRGLLLRSSRYDEQNHEAAQIILRSPDRYGPGLCAWARLFLSRDSRPAQVQDLIRASVNGDISSKPTQQTLEFQSFRAVPPSGRADAGAVANPQAALASEATV